MIVEAGDAVSVVILFGAVALWVVWSRQAVVERTEAADRIRRSLDRRPDNTPNILKAKIWQGRG